MFFLGTGIHPWEIKALGVASLQFCVLSPLRAEIWDQLEDGELPLHLNALGRIP